MKKIVTAIILLSFLFVFTSANYAQFKIGAFAGYGMSAFENQDEGAGYLPLGIQAYYSLEKLKFGSLNFGLEFNYAVSPFTFEAKDANSGQKLWESKLNQLVIAALIKVKFLKKNINPFIRLGAGLYTGNQDNEFTDLGKQYLQQNNLQPVEETKFKSAFGFNIGAGADYKVGKTGAVFFEFVYHIVSRAVDVEGAQSSGLNNWAVQAGFQVGLGK